MVYNDLINLPCIFMDAYNNRCKMLNLTVKEYEQVIKNYACITISTKLRDFQYRFLLKRILTNKELCKWGIKSLVTCETCGEPDIIHTLWECSCSCSAGMWQQLFAHISDKLDAGHLAFNAKGIVLNRVHPKYGHVVNLYCLVMKQLIYRCKCKREKLNFSLFLHEIQQIRQYELVLAKQ